MVRNITVQLTDKASGKLLNLTLAGKTLIAGTGLPDKMRVAEKIFSDTEEANRNFIKKEWEALKKGFALSDPEAGKGRPVLHRFIGGYYTGALSFEPTPHGVYVSKSGDQNNPDHFVLTDGAGNILSEVELPEVLAWNIEYRAATDSLLLVLDHSIYEYLLADGEFRMLAKCGKVFGRFVSVARNRTAFAADGTIRITDTHGNPLHAIPYDLELFRGHTHIFCGKLSPDGSLLAIHHNHAGEVTIYDTATGKEVKKIVGDFEITEQMDFADNNKILAVREMYGTRGMRWFDLSTGGEVQFPGLEVPEYTKYVDRFCFSPDGSKLVLVQRTWAYVFDFHAKKLLHDFEIEHVVKTCNVKFIGDKLGVRTDYGCFSIYNV